MKLKKKPLIFLVALFATVFIGTTFAYFYSVHTYENDFNLADYNVELKEYFPKDEWDEDNTLDKRVVISNGGQADVLLRISYNEMWYREENGEKEILNNFVNGNPVVKKNWTVAFTNDFTYKDGWYYYEKTLGTGESVTILDSIEKLITTIYTAENEKYQLDFNYEILQADNHASLRVWGYDSTINEEGDVDWDFLGE